MLRPDVKIGDKADFFGLDAYIYDVVPYSDYAWSVTLHVGNDGEEVNVIVPTDYHTSTGVNAYDEDDSIFDPTVED